MLMDGLNKTNMIDLEMVNTAQNNVCDTLRLQVVVPF